MAVLFVCSFTRLHTIPSTPFAHTIRSIHQSILTMSLTTNSTTRTSKRTNTMISTSSSTISTTSTPRRSASSNRTRSRSSSTRTPFFSQSPNHRLPALSDKPDLTTTIAELHDSLGLYIRHHISTASPQTSDTLSNGASDALTLFSSPEAWSFHLPDLCVLRDAEAEPESGWTRTSSLLRVLRKDYTDATFPSATITVTEQVLNNLVVFPTLWAQEFGYAGFEWHPVMRAAHAAMVGWVEEVRSGECVGLTLGAEIPPVHLYALLIRLLRAAVLSAVLSIFIWARELEKERKERPWRRRRDDAAWPTYRKGEAWYAFVDEYLKGLEKDERAIGKIFGLVDGRDADGETLRFLEGWVRWCVLWEEWCQGGTLEREVEEVKEGMDSLMGTIEG
ncbi:hypothetical protein M501DRAFT_1057547 [Patellaria atrata CBS 101060]|uniref:Uncharacterized protein n=1 Tax=Patellaria atrata CBS 101060 TaxID=1346257 RepID=A0A9P4SBA9_9PEZI|nr:hypothetical protein M501DRAFT_1057547 [Patellaria atrata CBS 101060]